MAAGGTTAFAPSQVASIVSRTSTVNNRANAQLSASLLHSFESGSAYSIDSAVYTMTKLAHAPTSGLSAFGIQIRSASVPRPSTYPYEFAIIGSTYSLPSRKPLPAAPCGSLRTLLVFERTSAAGAWDISLEPSVDGTAVGSFATGAGRYAPVVPAAASTAARELPAAVAHDLQQYEASGSLGPFARTDFTGKCWALPDPRSDLKSAEQARLSARELFSPTGQVAEFMLSGGRVLVIFTLSSTEQLLPSNVKRSIAWTSRPSQSLPSDLLPTGHYAQITELGQTEVAVVITAASPARFTVVGDYSGIESVTGTKSSAPAGPTGTSGGPGASGTSGGQLVSVGLGSGS